MSELDSSNPSINIFLINYYIKTGSNYNSNYNSNYSSKRYKIRQFSDIIWI